MDNLQKSEKVISLILERLIETGIQDYRLSNDSFDLSEDLRPFFTQCFKWLVAEGIVRADNTSEMMGGSILIFNPAITSYGFQVLGQTMELAGTDMKLATAVQEVSREDRSYSQVGDFFGGLLGGFTKSLGS